MRRPMVSLWYAFVTMRFVRVILTREGWGVEMRLKSSVISAAILCSR